MYTDTSQLPLDLIKVVDPINLTIIIVALILNTLLGFINIKRWRCFSNDLLLIQIASYADFTFTTSLLGIQILTLIKGPGVLVEHPRVCQITGMTVFATGAISITCVMLLGLLRYFVIVRGVYWKTHVWSFLVVGIVVFWLTLGGLAAYAKVFKVMNSGTYCSVYFDDENVFSKLLAIFLFVYLLLVDFLFVLNYVMITNQYLMYSEHLINESPELSVIVEKKKIKLRMIILIFSYQIVFLPTLIVGFIGIFVPTIRSAVVDAICSISLNLLTIINPICIIILHEDTKRELKRWFKKDYLLFSKKDQIQHQLNEIN